jgi:hypothetical protein
LLLTFGGQRAPNFDTHVSGSSGRLENCEPTILPLLS